MKKLIIIPAFKMCIRDRVFDECSVFEGEKVLEVGCGDASLWTQNIDLSLIHI